MSEVSELTLGKRGPHTSEQRVRASKVAAQNWKENRAAHIRGINRNLSSNPLRALRLKMGFSQADFAEEIGLSRNSANRIGQFENGMAIPEHLKARIAELAADHGLNWNAR